MGLSRSGLRASSRPSRTVATSPQQGSQIRQKVTFSTEAMGVHLICFCGFGFAVRIRTATS